MEVDEPAGGAAGPHSVEPLSVVFRDPGIASNVLSCLRMDEALPLRAAGKLTCEAVAAHPWDWETQGPPPPWIMFRSGDALRRWRACFPTATSVNLADLYENQFTDADVGVLQGITALQLSHCDGLTDACLAPLAESLKRVRINRCSTLSGAVLEPLSGRVTKFVFLPRHEGLHGVRDADLTHLAVATTVLLDTPSTGAPRHISDAGLQCLRAVRMLREPYAGGTPGAGLAALRYLHTLQLLLPNTVGPDDIAALLSTAPPTLTELTLK
jgi:hypothetical protein